MSSLADRLESARVELDAALSLNEGAGRHGFRLLAQQMHRVALQNIQPIEREDIVTWAEREIKLNPISNPGMKAGTSLRLSNFQKGLLRMMVAPDTRFFICPKSVQVGYSYLCAIVVFYVLAHLGLPAAFISRTDKDVDKWMKNFFHPMLKDPLNKPLFALNRSFKQGDDKDSLDQKIFRNGSAFYARTAASDDATKGFTVWLVVCDEIDSDTWKERVDGQGSKLDMLRARFTRFYNGRIIAGGSPTDARTSNVEREYAQSDQRKFFVPCPHCSGVVLPDGRAVENPDGPAVMKGFQTIDWGDGDAMAPGIKYKKREHDGAVIDAVYQCAHDSNHRIDEKGTKDLYDWKAWMDRHGEWMPTATGGKWRRGKYPEEWVQDRTDVNEETGEIGTTSIQSTAMQGYVGARIWAGYNPMLTWKYPCSEWEQARRKGIGSIRAFTQNILGKAFEARASFVKVQEDVQRKRCVSYPAEIPNDVLFIVGYVDAQEGEKAEDGLKERIEITLMGYGREDTAYLVGHWTIEGKLYKPEMIRKMEALFARKFRNEAGGYRGVLATGHDVGFDQGPILDYCRDKRGDNRVALRGFPDRTGLGKPEWSALLNVDVGGNKAKAWQWHYVDTLRAKDELAARIARGPVAGGIFFPLSATKLPGYFAGLLSSENRNPFKQGWKWEKIGHRSNEPFDCAAGCGAVRDWVKAHHPAFANYDKIVAVLPWEVPLTPTLTTNPWDGPDQSAQAREVMSGLEYEAQQEGIAARAAAAVQRPTSFTRSALTERPVVKPEQPRRAAAAEPVSGWIDGGYKSDGGGWNA